MKTYLEFWNKIVIILDESSQRDIDFEEGLFEGRYGCFYAALVEFIQNKKNQGVPTWTRKPQYTLKEPWFINEYKNPVLRIITMIETPSEFKSRNIFIEEDAFSRC